MGEDEMNAILTGEASLVGQVEKLGMLPPRKWCASHPLLLPFSVHVHTQALLASLLACLVGRGAHPKTWAQCPQSSSCCASSGLLSGFAVAMEMRRRCVLWSLPAAC